LGILSAKEKRKERFCVPRAKRADLAVSRRGGGKETPLLNFLIIRKNIYSSSQEGKGKVTELGEKKGGVSKRGGDKHLFVKKKNGSLAHFGKRNLPIGAAGRGGKGRGPRLIKTQRWQGKKLRLLQGGREERGGEAPDVRSRGSSVRSSDRKKFWKRPEHEASYQREEKRG